MSITVRQIPANGMTFRCREAAGTGEPVLLLHGFPEMSHMWLPLMERLQAKGYRCLAPDQRGYSPGARPEGADHYRYIDTASDALALADAWGADRFHLIGHDWGAGARWSVLAVNPQRLSWTALSVPHLAAFGGAIRTDPEQQQKSQYVTFFQQPGAAEALFGHRRLRAAAGRLRRLLAARPVARLSCNRTSTAAGRHVREATVNLDSWTWHNYPLPW